MLNFYRVILWLLSITFLLLSLVGETTTERLISLIGMVICIATEAIILAILKTKESE